MSLSGGNLSGYLQVNSYLRVNTASYGANKGYIYFGDGTLDRWIGYDGSNFALQNGSGGQIIIHSGNIGSQSVANAASAGNASLLTSNVGNAASSLQYWQAIDNPTLNPSAGWWYGLRMSHGDATTYYNVTMAFDFHNDKIMFRRKEGGVDLPWQTLWHTGNDGSGSGLDADLLDGQHASYFATASQLNAANLSNGYLPYWNNGSLVNSPITTNGTDLTLGSGKVTLTENINTRLRIPKLSGTPTGLTNNEYYLFIQI